MVPSLACQLLPGGEPVVIDDTVLIELALAEYVDQTCLHGGLRSLDDVRGYEP